MTGSQIGGQKDIIDIKSQEIHHSEKFETNEADKEIVKIPEIGNKIYVPSSYSFSSPSEDVSGGLATIKNIEKLANGDFIINVEEHPNFKDRYGWKKLISEQDELMKEYNGKLAKANPDTNIYSDDEWKRSPSELDGGWVQSK